MAVAPESACDAHPVPLEHSRETANPFRVLGHRTVMTATPGWREPKATDVSTSTHPVRTPANLLFETTTGVTVPIADLVGPNGAVLFFMRTSTCPVCRRHLKELSEVTSEISTSGRRLVIVIPDGIEAARKLGERYPTLQIVVGDAASDAQRDLGLGAKFGLTAIFLAPPGGFEPPT
jgi:hypothetical protein